MRLTVDHATGTHNLADNRCVPIIYKDHKSIVIIFDVIFPTPDSRLPTPHSLFPESIVIIFDVIFPTPSVRLTRN
ncbi:hypothetical protein BJP36_41350 [Moorena producens JHB]|uniref:Uncharacterized protein n=1 Tax=Moorena producens (strain JHB) TaxID=1454205 RepID=A0A9Q9SSF6_MOOP1|nr:hypothetical protein [Moorena producens]WAN68812.1 hypothetical protein BJP36_41350 [Moorena producens JHB]